MMKKLVYLIFAVFLLTSCGSSRNARIAKTNLRGDWQLYSITYDAQGLYKVNLLQDASKECFVNSIWHFVVNNASGTYQFKNSKCPSEKRYFYYSVEETDKDKASLDILIKPTDRKKHSQENNKGFRFHLLKLSEDDMQWSENLNIDGQAFTIYLHFKHIK